MLFSLSVPLSHSESRSRLTRLAAVTVPLAGSVLYNLLHQQGYQISLLSCPLRSLTGIPCPTCGITRSFMAAARGNWGEAIGYHAFGLILFLILLIAALHLLLELGLQRRIDAIYGGWLRDRRWQISSVASLLLYYGIRLHGWASSGELFAAMRASAIGHWLF